MRGCLFSFCTFSLSSMRRDTQLLSTLLSSGMVLMRWDIWSVRERTVFSSSVILSPICLISFSLDVFGVHLTLKRFQHCFIYVFSYEILTFINFNYGKTDLNWWSRLWIFPHVLRKSRVYHQKTALSHDLHEPAVLWWRWVELQRACLQRETKSWAVYSRVWDASSL